MADDDFDDIDFDEIDNMVAQHLGSTQRPPPVTAAPFVAAGLVNDSTQPSIIAKPPLAQQNNLLNQQGPRPAFPPAQRKTLGQQLPAWTTQHVNNTHAAHGGMHGGVAAQGAHTFAQTGAGFSASGNVQGTSMAPSYPAVAASHRPLTAGGGWPSMAPAYAAAAAPTAVLAPQPAAVGAAGPAAMPLMSQLPHASQQPVPAPAMHVGAAVHGGNGFHDTSGQQRHGNGSHAWAPGVFGAGSMPHRMHYQHQTQGQDSRQEELERTKAMNQHLLQQQDEVGQENQRLTKQAAQKDALLAATNAELLRAQAREAQLLAELEQERESARHLKAHSPGKVKAEHRPPGSQGQPMAVDAAAPSGAGGQEDRQTGGSGAAAQGRAASRAGADEGGMRAASMGAPSAAAVATSKAGTADARGATATQAAAAVPPPTGLLAVPTLMHAAAQLRLRRPALWQRLWSACGASLCTLMGVPATSGEEASVGSDGGAGSSSDAAGPGPSSAMLQASQLHVAAPHSHHKVSLHHRQSWADVGPGGTQAPPLALSALRIQLQQLAATGTSNSAGQGVFRHGASRVRGTHGLSSSPPVLHQDAAAAARSLTAALSLLAMCACQLCPRTPAAAAALWLSPMSGPSKSPPISCSIHIVYTAAASGGPPTQPGGEQGGPGRSITPGPSPSITPSPHTHGSSGHAAADGPGTHPMLPTWTAAALDLVWGLLEHTPDVHLLLCSTLPVPHSVADAAAGTSRPMDVAQQEGAAASGGASPPGPSEAGSAHRDAIRMHAYGCHDAWKPSWHAGGPAAASVSSTVWPALGETGLLPALLAVMQHVADAHHTDSAVLSSVARVLEAAARQLPAMTVRRFMQPVLRWRVPSVSLPVAGAPGSSHQPSSAPCPEDDEAVAGLLEHLLLSSSAPARLAGVRLLHCLMESPHICAAISTAAVGHAEARWGSGGAVPGEPTRGGVMPLPPVPPARPPPWAAPLEPERTQHMLLALLDAMQPDLQADSSWSPANGAGCSAMGAAHSMLPTHTLGPGTVADVGAWVRGGPSFSPQGRTGDGEAAGTSEAAPATGPVGPVAGRLAGWKPVNPAAAEAWGSAAEASVGPGLGPFELHRRILTMLAMLLETRQVGLLAGLCSAPWLFRMPGLAQRLLAMAEGAISVPGWPLEAAQPPAMLLPPGARVPMCTLTLGAWAQRGRVACEALLLLKEMLLTGSELLHGAALDDLVLEPDAQQATCLACAKLMEWQLPESLLASTATPAPTPLVVAPWALRLVAAVSEPRARAGLPDVHAAEQRARAGPELVMSLTTSVQRRAYQRMNAMAADRRRLEAAAAGGEAMEM